MSDAFRKWMNAQKPFEPEASGFPQEDELPFFAYYTEDGALMCKCAICEKVYPSFVEASELIGAEIEGSYCGGSPSCCP